MTEFLHLVGIIGLVLFIFAALIWLVANIIRKKDKKLPLAVMVISFVLLIVMSPSTYTIRPIVRQNAENALLGQLANVESAELVSTEIFDDKRTSHGLVHHYLVLIEVRHENDAGGVVEQSYLVWVRHFPGNDHRIVREIKPLVPGWGYAFTMTDPVLGIRAVSAPPTQEEIADIKKLVRWPEE